MGIFKWKRLGSMMLAGVFCGSAVGASAFADDDGKNQPPAKPAAVKIDATAPLTERERQLLDRVKQLEKRMAELEGKAQPAAAVSAPDKHMVAGSPQDGKPSDHRHPREVLKLQPLYFEC